MQRNRHKTNFMRTVMLLLACVFTSATAWAEVKSYIDVCRGGIGEVCISGWVYDTQMKAYETSNTYGIAVRAVVSPTSGGGDPVESYDMEYLERPDVNKTFGLTGKHGFKTKVFVYPDMFGENPEITVNVKIYATIGKGYYANPEVVQLKSVNTTVRMNYGYGTEEIPYIISNAADWDLMATPELAPFYADSYIRLANVEDDYHDYDNSTAITKPFGTSTYPFTGHFDGKGQTLSVNINSTEMCTAPFCRINNATIRNLTVTGTVSSSANHASGLVGACANGSVITDCIVHTNVSGAPYAGGIVGHGSSGKLTIERCIYDGTISGFTKYAGGLLGWCENLTLNMQNCLFKGSFSPDSGGSCHPIACKNAKATVTATVVDAYYIETEYPSWGINKTYIIPEAKGRPVSSTFIVGVHDETVTAADGQIYYLTTSKCATIGNHAYSYVNLPVVSETYSKTLQLYKAEEIGKEGSIIAISFYYTGSEPFCMEGIQVYMKETNQSGIWRDAMEFSETNKVYDGPFSSTSGPDWVTIVLDKPFEYDGLGNIVVCVFDNNEDNSGYWTKFYCTLMESNNYTLLYRTSKYKPSNIYDSAFQTIKNDGLRNDIRFYLKPFSFPRPENLITDNTSDESATLSWEAPETDKTIMRYSYIYKKSDETDWSAPVTVQATSANIHNLVSNTDYNFRVKAIYDEGNSNYIQTSFSTAMALPYEYGFEDGTSYGWEMWDGWNMVDCKVDYSSDWDSPASTGIRKRAAHDGNLGFMFTCWEYAPQYLISPRFAGNNSMEVSFYYRKESRYSNPLLFQVGYSTTTSDPSAFIWDNEISPDGEWSLYGKVFPAGTKFVAVRYNSKAENYTAADKLFIDDFYFVEYSAYTKPTNLVATSLTHQGVTLTWTAPNVSVSGYAYQYKKANEKVWSTETMTTAVSVTLSDLDANTNYQFRVRSLYAYDNASNYATVRFLTEGPPVNSLPFYEGFENSMGGWRVFTLQSGIYNESSDYIHDGECSFELGQHDALISPQFDVNDPILVSFYCRNHKDDNNNYIAFFQVGYSTMSKDLNDFTWSDIAFTTTEWHKYSYLCPAGTKYFAVRWSDGFLIYLDDFTFTPNILPTVPHDIAVTNITAFSADLSWSANTEMYELRYRKKADDAGNDLSDWTTVTPESRRFRLLSLQTETEYEFQVRSNSYGTYSDWSDVFTFTTNTISPLFDDNDNTALIDAMAGFTGNFYDVMLVGRTLYKDGDWNTLCLPFNVSNLNETPLESATVKTLGSAAFADGTLTMNFMDATSIEAGKPYIVKWNLPTPDLIISSDTEWNTFAQNVNNGTESYEGKFVQLGADINVSTMVGTAEHPFCGIFDGKGHTLNLSISHYDVSFAAPFRYISDATICNVKTTGSVTGGQYCSGLVGATLGNTNSIRNCWMDVKVTSFEGYMGGIVGHGSTSNTKVSNCYLSGAIKGYNNVGIIYGWGDEGGTHAVENCWANVTFNAPGDFNLVLTNGGVISVSNCRRNPDDDLVTQGVYYIPTSNSEIVDFLGSEWTLDDNENLALKHTTDVANITSPVFKHMPISNTITPVKTDYVNFIGITSPVPFTANDRTKLYLGSNNKLYYPGKDMTLSACRAYFQLNGLSMSDITETRIFFEEDPITEVIGVNEVKEVNDDIWYTIDGRKLDKQPTKAGLYIVDGKKIVIK